MSETSNESRLRAIEGCLIGTAVGDALGLPWEGLSRQHIARKWGNDPLRHRFIFGRGMVSDDTEHAWLVAQAFLRSGNGKIHFANALARGMRSWFLSLPAGIGLATLKACLKLCVGVPSDRSGVRSAGNGPAMRAPMIGVCFADDLDDLIIFCDDSSVMTHTDVRAVYGARVAALAARNGVLNQSVEEFFAIADEHVAGSEEWRDMLRRMHEGLELNVSVEEFARSIGAERRVTGFVMQSVPVALYAWLLHRNDFRRAVDGVVRLGGDTDTTAAITGALCGAAGSHIPEELVRGIWEWPRSIPWMRSLALRICENGRPMPVAWPLIPIRNALFTVTVLYHGLRRLI